MSTNPYSVGAMQAEFHRLGQEREKILSQSGPLRAERDKILAEAEAKARELASRFKVIEKDLFDIDCRRGMLARALAKGHRVARTGKSEQ